MANNLDVQMLKSLTNEVSNLVKMLKTEKISSRSENRGERVKNTEQRSRKEGILTSEEVIYNFKKLSKEVEFTLKSLKDERHFIEKVGTALSDLLVPSTNLGKVLKTSTKEFKQYVKNNSDDFKTISQNTLGSFQKIWSSGGDVSKSLNNIVKMHDALTKSYSKVINSMDEIKSSSDLKSTEMKLIDELNKKKSELNATSATDTEKINSIKKEISDLDNSIKKINVKQNALSSSEAKNKKNIDEFFAYAEELAKDNINIFEGINKSELEYEKFIKKSNKDREALLKKLNDNINAINAGIRGFENSLNDYKVVLDKNKEALKRGMKTFFTGLITRGATRAIDDYQSMQKYNITSWMPMEAGNMGMSTADLATLIGQNKMLFRMMGRGDENAPFANGQFKDLQNNAKMFGVNGKEAADLAVTFANLNIETGNSISTIKTQMDQFKKLTDTTGESVDSLIDFYKDLNKTGALNALNVKYANKTESERIQLISKEVDARIRLNKELGYNIDHLKQQNQLASNQQFADVEEMVKRELGLKMTLNAFNKSNSNKITGRDALDAMLPEGALLQLQDKDVERYNKAIANREQLIQFQSKGYQNLDRSALNAANVGNSPSLADVGNRVMLNLRTSLAPTELGQSRIMEAREAQNKAVGQSGPAYIKNVLDGMGFTNLFGKYANKTIDQLNVEDIGKASDSVTAGFNAVGKNAAILAEKLEGYSKSIPGNAISLADSANFAAAITNVLTAGRGGGLLGKIFDKTAPILTETGIGRAVVTALSRVVLPVAVFSLAVEAGRMLADVITNTDGQKKIEREADALYGNSWSFAKMNYKMTREQMGEGKNEKYGLPDLNDSKYQQFINERLDVIPLLENRFSGSNKQDLFGMNGMQAIDRKLLNAFSSKLIDVSDLEKFGAGSDYINNIKKMQSIADTISSGGDVDRTQLTPVEEAMLKMADDIKTLKDNVIKTNEENKQAELIKQTTRQKAESALKAALDTSSSAFSSAAFTLNDIR